MQNRWDAAAAPPAGEPLAECVYGSRLLGSEPNLVLHGGGNTSVKGIARMLTGESIEVLYVKGSGWDLASIEARGFPALRLARLRELLALERMTDSEMMNELRCARLDATAPDPSVESLLHAMLPYGAVQHSHADALIALTNARGGEAIVRELYGDEVVYVPYVMPGFNLARACVELFPAQVHARTLGMVLLNHGLFTFGADAREAYDRHIELARRAEQYLAARGASPAAQSSAARARGTADDRGRDLVEIAELRKRLCDAAGQPMVVTRSDDPRIRAFVDRSDLADVATRGPATPDHVIRTKRVPLIGRDVGAYVAAYREYFDAHRARGRAELTMLDPAPRVVLDPELGMLTAGRRAADAAIVRDIYEHTIEIIDAAEALGGYQALPAADLFDVEYWELEQAKLQRGAPPPFTGEVALVTGAASGIGRACAAALQARGAAVVGLDLSFDPAAAFAAGPIAEKPREDRLELRADVTDRDQLAAALAVAVDRFGGIDIVVASAGVFPTSQPLAELDLDQWQHASAVNAGSLALLLKHTHPLLKLAARHGRVVLIASKNVPAPGPGAGAYSSSKAAAAQLARVAALEWASDGIRVNMVHPDAVFDTGLWTAELLAQRANHYGLTIDEYKRRNLLGTEITSNQIGELVATVCGDAFAATTGAQIPADGGNERVI